MSSHDKSNVTLAIILTFAAGLSTVIGASVSFCIKPEQVHVLPISLAFSAGVMIYVSFVEIVSEAQHSFEESLQSKKPNSYEFLAHIYVSLTLFGGIAIGYLLDFIVHLLGYKHKLMSKSDFNLKNKNNEDTSSKIKSVPSHTDNISTNNNDRLSIQDDDEEIELQESGVNLPLNSPKDRTQNDIKLDDDNDSDNSDESNIDDQNMVIEKEESKQLIKTSLITALAIALHNFPEGLATFVSTLADPTLGVSIAVAIAIHNIPEGVAVAMPIYFATQSKIKAFFWSFVSGIAEPIGGLVGYAIINNLFSEAVFGVLFGFTGGIMIYISFRELLPTARKRDTDDRYTTILVFAGFLVMDISLILFDAV